MGLREILGLTQKDLRDKKMDEAIDIGLGIKDIPAPDNSRTEINQDSTKNPDDKLTTPDLNDVLTGKN